MAGQNKLDQALGTHITIDSTNIGDDVIVEADIGPGAVTTTELADTSVTAAKVDYFKSGTLTGTATAQSTAHGLGRTPALVLVLMQEGGVTGQVTEGAHDGTNVIVTAPVGMDYVVVAL
jgi:hypothetical protein